MPRNVIDLFCGAAGGWSLGLHRAGFRTVAACESDPWRRAVFLQNNPDAVMYDDVRTLTGDRIVSDLGFRPDIVVGSPPCQDASIARRGDRTGIAGERTGLFSEYLRLVRELRPAWACAENVLGLVGVGADEIASEMVAAGYQPRILDMGAEDFGSTAERRRLWFIAVADAHEARLQNAWRERPRDAVGLAQRRFRRSRGFAESVAAGRRRCSANGCRDTRRCGLHAHRRRLRRQRRSADHGSDRAGDLPCGG